MTFDIVPNLTTWSTFWQFDWHIENLIDILTIWLTFWQLGWHFDILFVSRQIWKDLVKSSSSKNHIFTLGHFGRHLDLTQIETAQSGRLHVYNNEEHVETLWRGRWQQWRTDGNSSIRKMTGTAGWEPKAFLLQLNRVSRNLKRKGKKKVFPDISNKTSTFKALTHCMHMWYFLSDHFHTHLETHQPVQCILLSAKGLWTWSRMKANIILEHQ